MHLKDNHQHLYLHMKREKMSKNSHDQMIDPIHDDAHKKSLLERGMTMMYEI